MDVYLTELRNFNQGMETIIPGWKEAAAECFRGFQKSDHIIYENYLEIWEVLDKKLGLEGIIIDEFESMNDEIFRSSKIKADRRKMSMVQELNDAVNDNLRISEEGNNFGIEPFQIENSVETEENFISDKMANADISGEIIVENDSLHKPSTKIKKGLEKVKFIKIR